MSLPFLLKRQKVVVKPIEVSNDDAIFDQLSNASEERLDRLRSRVRTDNADVRNFNFETANNLHPAQEVNNLQQKRFQQSEQKPILERARVEQAISVLRPIVMELIDISIAARMKRDDLFRELMKLVSDLQVEHKLPLNSSERYELAKIMLDDMLGFGPIEPLLADDTISEIMVNGPNQVYIERNGKLILSNTKFRDHKHIQAVAVRIATLVGRRVDETTPLCDARLSDGSRVNIIIPPLAIDGPTITIRKFTKKKMTLDTLVKMDCLSQDMADVFRIFGRSRLNILISGGTGSGKTTLLNALSEVIDSGERIVTIEDAAELQLMQPHVIRLETRPSNIEGDGEISIRDLLKNALRMRPDRIIVGETRSFEAAEMLQAMNTGHDGSLSTIHANNPRDALMRLENLVGMANGNLPLLAIRQQIAAAIDLIIQVSRMRDGSRRVIRVSEIIGMKADKIMTQDLFSCDVEGETPEGLLNVQFKKYDIKPHCLSKVAYYGLDEKLMKSMC